MILDLKRRVAAVALILASVAVCAPGPRTQQQTPVASIKAILHTLDSQPQTAARPARPFYETRANHDPDGTGKFYMGREIAQVMGPGGIDWLERPTREDEERPTLVINTFGLRGNEVVADLGAGSGYFSFRIAPKVGKTGKVLALDIQDEMLETIRERAAKLRITNVQAVKGSEKH